MQGQHHDSLETYSNNFAWSPQYSASSSGVMAAHAVTAALSNPYSQTYSQFSYPQASHYAQAYAQYRPLGSFSAVGTTAEGYTLSPTYVTGSYHGNFQNNMSAGPSQNPFLNPQNSRATSHWYQTGNCKCTHRGCSFIGSKKAVEIHMMDRHLIYPPSWENRKRKSDWDADPSLKGKPIPIQGTTIKLDTPEAIEEWIAERKKRFPTAIRVEEKEKKLEEAIARGQLPIGDNRFPQFKRRRLNERSQGANSHYSTGTNDMNERGPRRGRGRGRGRGTDRGWQGRADRVSTMSRENAFHESPHDTVLQQPSDAPQTLTSSSTTRPSRSREQNSNFDATDSDSDSDGAPEVISSKGPSNPTEKELSQPDIQASAQASEIQATDLIQGTPTSAVQPLQPTKKSLRQPRRPPRNPFAARHSLLWNLLHPEIRTTVSNLSQAIRFLVDNDFLENVELRPGQASEKMIEVVGSSTSEDPMGISMKNMTSQVADTAPMS